MFIEIKEARYVGNYTLELTFNTGETKYADLQDSLVGKVFEPLKNPENFKRFKINFNTIEWENGADFAPEYLYQISKSNLHS
ncbi:MAG: DUF2442 domain-containing protein [Bacteroidota bacterium]